MRNSWSLVHPVLITIAALFAHTSIRHNLVSLLPLPLLLSTTLVWTTSSPGYYLAALAIAGELLGGLPPGIMTILVLTPFFVFRLRRQIQVDISFSYVGLLIITTLVQLLLLSLPHLLLFLLAAPTWAALPAVIPWQLLSLMLLLNTLATWLLTLGSITFAPPEYQPSALFDRKFYGSSSRH